MTRRLAQLTTFGCITAGRSPGNSLIELAVIRGTRHLFRSDDIAKATSEGKHRKDTMPCAFKRGWVCSPADICVQ